MLREMFAKKMLDEKLDFLWFEDSYKLFLSDEKVENTKFSWVYNSEELWDICLRYWNTLDEVKKEMIEVHWYEEFVVWNWYDEFKEFTVKVCPAVTYTDLIK
jgi:hypothetical protein